MNTVTIQEDEKELAARHEANHAVVGELILGRSKLAYVTIEQCGDEWIGETYRCPAPMVDIAEQSNYAMARVIMMASGDAGGVREYVESGIDNAGVGDDVEWARNVLANEFGTPAVKDVDATILIACEFADRMLALPLIASGRDLVADALMQRGFISGAKVQPLLSWGVVDVFESVKVDAWNMVQAAVLKATGRAY